MIFHCAEPPLHCRTPCNPVYLVCLLKTSGILQPPGQPKPTPPFSNVLQQRERSPHREAEILYHEKTQYGGPKGSMFSGLLCFLAWHPICVLQNVKPRLVLQSMPDRSPARTRSSTAVVPEPQTQQVQHQTFKPLTSRFQCH